MTWLLIQRIRLHSWLSRRVPISLAQLVDDMAYELMKKAKNAKPQKRRKKPSTKPWLGEAVCHNIDCRHIWNVFAPQGIDPDVDLECPECTQSTGALA